MTAADPGLSQAPQAPRRARGLGFYLGWMDRAFEKARAADKAPENARLRIFFVLALFACAFFCLGLFAVQRALFPARPDAHAGLAPLRNARADLVDRNGQILAMDLLRYGLYLTPREVSDPDQTRAALLAADPSIRAEALDRALHGDKKQYYVASGLTPEQRDRIHDLALPGLDFQEEVGRAYPLGQTGAHVIGFASSDGRGVSGAERAFDHDLRGGAGHGQVALSLDLRVQGALQDELQTAADHFAVKDAVGVVVNVRTGEILGMASYPGFDLAQMDHADPAATVNHAAATVFEPGSVFKVFTLAMGLDTGRVKPTSVFDVCSPLVLPGQIIHDYDKGDCALPLWEVFTHSSNIGAAKMALSVGGDAESRYFHDFGLFDRAPSELVESARPLTPARITANSVATMAFGQSISVSPLALATGMSAILDGGVYRPLTLRRLPDGQAPAAGRRVIQESTARTMLGLMRLNATNGTGRSADQLAPGYMVGGKTGTATKLVNGHYALGKRNLASFAAVFPTDGGFDQDRYLVLVMMDEPKVTAETGGYTTGGAVSAPLAGKIIARIAPLLNARRVADPADEPPKGANKDKPDPAIIARLAP